MQRKKRGEIQIVRRTQPAQIGFEFGEMGPQTKECGGL